MTATKLERIEEYVRNMSPVVRIALLVDDITAAGHKGWDTAMYQAQKDLLAILEEE